MPRFFNLKIYASDWSQPLRIKARPNMVIYKLKTFVAGRLGLDPDSIRCGPLATAVKALHRQCLPPRLCHDGDVAREHCVGDVLADYDYEEDEDVIFQVLLEQIGC